MEDAETASPLLWHVHVDHLNRPVRMTNAAKAVVWDAVWTPWGQPHSITGTGTNNARFPGQWFQLEAGLHYNWHRHYDPSIGRYTQPDPLGFVDGPSVYGYAVGSPGMLVDPSGLWILWWGGGGTYALGPGGTASGGAGYDSSTGQAFTYGSAGWQTGVNAGLTTQVGLFSGNMSDFEGRSAEFQLSVPLGLPLPIGLGATLKISNPNKCKSQRHYGLSLGPSVGLPVGFSGGGSWTWITSTILGK